MKKKTLKIRFLTARARDDARIISDGCPSNFLIVSTEIWYLDGIYAIINTY